MHIKQCVKINLKKKNFPEKYEIFYAMVRLSLYEIISALKLSDFNLTKNDMASGLNSSENFLSRDCRASLAMTIHAAALIVRVAIDVVEPCSNLNILNQKNGDSTPFSFIFLCQQGRA
jgi:hypothetical protein